MQLDKFYISKHARTIIMHMQSCLWPAAYLDGKEKIPSVLRKNDERSKYAAPKSLPVSIRLSPLQSTAGPLTTKY